MADTNWNEIDNLRIAEAINTDVVAVVTEDLGISVRAGGGGDGGGHEEGEDDELQEK